MQEEANLITIYDFSAEKGVEYLQFDGGEWQASRLPKELTEEYKNVFTVDTGIEKSLVKKVLSDETDGNIRKIKFEADNLGKNRLE